MATAATIASANTNANANAIIRAAFFGDIHRVRCVLVVGLYAIAKLRRAGIIGTVHVAWHGW